MLPGKLRPAVCRSRPGSDRRLGDESMVGGLGSREYWEAVKEVKLSYHNGYIQ